MSTCDTCQKLLNQYHSAVSAYLKARDAGDEQCENYRQACRSASELLLAHVQADVLEKPKPLRGKRNR